jgi:acyl-CoA thioester hydrolase
MNNGNVFRYPLDVRFFEVDSLGVVFNMWYLGWCDEAMSAFMESIGYGYATLRAQGFDAVLRNARIEWVDSLEAFQHAEIAVRVDHVGTTSFRLRYDIERVDPGEQAGRAVQTSQTGESGQAGRRWTPCAQVEIVYVCVELNGRSKTPLPLGLREALVQDHS